jgi:hypothetical protein
MMGMGNLGEITTTYVATAVIGTLNGDENVCHSHII